MTYRILLQTLQNLSDKQLDSNVFVSAGCDENGNADFLIADTLVLATDNSIEAGVPLDMNPEQPILLFQIED